MKNIRENMVITAQYRKKKCTVIFVDWDKTSLNIKEFDYGDVLTLDALPEKKVRSLINGQMQMERSNHRNRQHGCSSFIQRYQIRSYLP